LPGGTSPGNLIFKNMESKNNLPAVNREINLFTTEKNVNKDIVETVERCINQIKVIKIKGDINGLSIGIFKRVPKIPIDTFSYILSMYGFKDVRIQSDYDNNIIVESCLNLGDYKHLYIYSEPIKINLLPNDIKMVIKE